MRMLLVAAVILVTAAVAVAGPERVKKPTGGAEAAIAAEEKAWEAAANAKDAAKIASLYTEDAVLMPPNAPALRGRVNIQAFWQGMLDRGARDITLAGLQTSVSGALAYRAGTYAFTMQPAGGQPMQDWGKFLIGLKRDRGGRWRITHDIFNSDLACTPETPAAKR